MSHFTVLVAADNREQLEHRLAPFDENGEWGCDGSHWDWWVIGGRWTGKLKLKPGASGKTGKPGVRTDPNHDPTRCDAAFAGDVDWDGMIQEQVARDLLEWDAFQAIPLPTEADIEDKLQKATERWKPDRTEFDGPRALAAYWHYEQALNKAGYVMTEYSEVKRLMLPHEQFVATCKANALTFAFVDLEGRWVESGSMGWWGVVSNENQDYDQAFWAFVRSLPPEQKVYVVDCHV